MRSPCSLEHPFPAASHQISVILSPPYKARPRAYSTVYRYLFNRMAAAERFGPAEQTPAQRQVLLDEVEALKATQGRPPLRPFGQRLYRRYVAGEPSLAECSAQLRRHYGRA